MSDFGKAQHKPKVAVLVDFSNFAAVCWYPALQAQNANPALYKAEQVLLTNVEGKLGTMRQDFERLGVVDYHLIFVEDRHSERKYMLYPLYKANREPNEVDYRTPAKEWLVKNGYVSWCYSPKNEADDAIATLVANRADDVTVIVASTDKDLWQLLDPPGVNVYHLTKGTLITSEDVQEKFKVSDAKFIPLHKALWGDSGDNVPNAVPRMQKQLLPLIEASDGSLTGFFTNVNNNFAALTERCQKLIKEGGEQVVLNFDLVKLDPNCPIEFERDFT
jgi:5'-3' exonuclease